MGQNIESSLDGSLDAEIQTLQTYLLIRDGVLPSSSQKEKLDDLRQYQASFNNAQKLIPALQAESASCQKFETLYTKIGEQTIYYYRELLYSGDQDISPSLRENIIARLYSLNLFETAFLGLVLRNSEGGSPYIDPQDRHVCVLQNRKAWKRAMVQAHVALLNLNRNVFGIPSATSFSSDLQSLNSLSSYATTQRRIERIGYTVASFAASLFLWLKAAAPILRQLRSKVESPTLRVLITILGGGIYTAAWMKANQEAYDHLPYFNPDRALKGSSPSKWVNLMKTGEELTSADIMSPSLHLAYLKLITELDRRRDLIFLIDNQVFLTEMEQKYGSIDAALIHLKEERENETSNQRAG